MAYDHFSSDHSISPSNSPLAADSEPTGDSASGAGLAGDVTGGTSGAASEITTPRTPKRLDRLPNNTDLRKQIVSASPNPAEADAALAAVQSLRIATLLARRDKILAERAKYQHDAKQWRDKTAALGKQVSRNSAFQAVSMSGAGASRDANGEQDEGKNRRVNIDDISLRAIVKDGKGYRASFAIEGKHSVSGRNGGVLIQGIRIKSIASDRAVLVSGAENRTLYAF